MLESAARVHLVHGGRSGTARLSSVAVAQGAWCRNCAVSMAGGCWPSCADCCTSALVTPAAGADPTAMLQRFGERRGWVMGQRLHLVSLGQGQGLLAETMIKQAATAGDWVCLQNCHLAASWMRRLQEQVRGDRQLSELTHRKYATASMRCAVTQRAISAGSMLRSAMLLLAQSTPTRALASPCPAAASSYCCISSCCCRLRSWRTAPARTCTRTSGCG